ncbi:MAG: alpha/beta hydrolase [Chloroflexi bacterium]|nr:alpha/beta fold hydrolase [Anaerolineaceae bacterium]NMB89347.1 alpha/beta hydrolase [Chloroflexota bacterium]
MTQLWVILVILLAGLALAGLGSLWLRYREEIRAARRRIEGLGSQVVETACGPVEYARVGEGAPLLVVHGAMGGFDQGLWLARGFDLCKYQVISLSRFGYLRSPVPAGAGLDLQADAFAALLDALGIPRAAVFAASAGTTAALRLAARYPGRVSALVLLSPDAPGEAQMSLPPRFVFDTLLRSDFVYWLLVTFWGRWVQNAIGLVPRGYALTPEQAAMIRTIQHGDLPVSGRMDGMLFESYTVLPEYNALLCASSAYPLQQIETPVLVIHALDDSIAIPANVNRLAAAIPGARQFTLPDGGHFLLGHVEEARAEIERFLDAHAGSFYATD